MLGIRLTWSVIAAARIHAHRNYSAREHPYADEHAAHCNAHAYAYSDVHKCFRHKRTHVDAHKHVCHGRPRPYIHANAHRNPRVHA